MRRLAVSLIQAVALLVGLAGCGGGPGPDEVVIAQIVFTSSGLFAPPLTSDVFRFSVAADADTLATRVCDGVGVTPADQGRTFTVRPGDDVQFGALAAILTNGADDPLELNAASDVGGVGEISAESIVVVGLNSGFTGPNLTGFTLTKIQLVVDQFSTTPAVGQTNFQFSVRFVFLGTRP